jgi:hypothetical protein
MLICPHCHEEVPDGASVRRGCAAEARYGCSEPRCACFISLVVGIAAWCSFPEGCTLLFKLVFTPDQNRALPQWVLDLEYNGAVFRSSRDRRLLSTYVLLY